MDVAFKYGMETLYINTNDKNVASIIEPNLPPADNTKEEIKHSLTNPIKSLSLKDIVMEKRPGSVAIVVADISRPIPYMDILPAVLKEFENGGVNKEQISFIIATGAHRPNTEKETKEVFGSLTKHYRFINHDCDNKLTSLGFLNNGTELLINTIVARADMVVTIGCIMPHNLAGFSGGPKLLVPGVAGRKTIECNHRMMNNQGVGPGMLVNNPIPSQMMEGARRVGLNFSINVVLNQQNQIIKSFAGDMEAAWLAGCSYCQRVYQLSLPAPEEVVIAGAGGYPRDLNLYQAIKALVNGDRLTKPGGTIVLVAQCQEGMGDPLFEKWLNEARTPKDILYRFKSEEFKIGAHKAYVICEVLKNKEVILISDLAKSKNQVPLLKSVGDWEIAEKLLIKKHGSDYRALILPFAGLVFPLSGQDNLSNK